MIYLTEKLKKLLPQIQEYVENELIPLEPQLLSKNFSEVEHILNAKRLEVKEKGWWCPQLSEEEGGMGLTLVEFGMMGAVLGMTPFGHYVFNCQAPDAGNMELLIEYGSAEQKKKWLEPLIAGDIRSCFSMTEPEFAGSNPVQMATTAMRHGDEYVVNGHKWFTSSADGSAFAIVMAVTNPKAENPYARASMVIVPTDDPNFELVRNIPIMGEAGDGYASHAEVRYHDCRVPAENLIAIEGSGFKLAQTRLGPGRIHHCMRWIGICERALDLMCKRAATREIAPGKMLGTKQSIQNWIAESKAELLASRLMVLHTAYNMQHQGAKAVKEEISTIKFYVANVLQQILDRAIQVHGALGITDDTVLSYWFRHERGARIYDGPDETHKAALARKVLKAYGLKVRTH